MPIVKKTVLRSLAPFIAISWAPSVALAQPPTPSNLGTQVFQDVASHMGRTGMSGLGHSVGWGDIDNDGDPDVALGDQTGTGFWLFRNDGNASIMSSSSAKRT